MQVIGHIRSRAFRVLWMLEELGEAYEHLSAKPHSQEVLTYNPSGKIPIFRDRATTITDSTAILGHLAETRGRFTHACGTVKRAHQDAWTCLLLDEFDACVWAAAKHSFVLPEEWRVRDLKPTLRWEFQSAASRLSARLGSGPYLMGEEFTVPDIILTHCCDWAELAKFDVSEPGILSYLERTRLRPAYRRTIAMR